MGSKTHMARIASFSLVIFQCFLFTPIISQCTNMHAGAIQFIVWLCISTGDN